MQVEIKGLTPQLAQDYLDFFDKDAFCDNPHWASCYCYFYLNQLPHEAWIKRTGEENRQAVAALIESGKMKGYLAYANSQVVGWCHANGMDQLPRLDQNKPKTAAIVCYIIAPRFRRKGIATRLLEVACLDLKEKGYQWLEAYPRAAEITGDPENYHGPLSMYQKRGFEITEQNEQIYVMVKKL